MNQVKAIVGNKVQPALWILTASVILLRFCVL